MNQLNNIFNSTVYWQMTFQEKSALLHLISNIKNRNVAIEVGSYRGGFLQILSQYFDKVYSLDINHERLELISDLDNVVYITGDSKDTLPELIKKIRSEEKEDINFILIDGDHSFEAVQCDISSVLENHIPKTETYLMLHDSWYKPVREAIVYTDWNGCEYVHKVETDFCTGDMNDNVDEGLIYVGGLCLVHMSSEKREDDEEVIVEQTYDFMYRMVNNMLDRYKEDIRVESAQ